MGGLVHQALDHEDALGPPGAAIRPGRVRGRIRGRRLDVDRGHHVGARHRPAVIAYRPRAVDDELRAERDRDSRAQPGDLAVGSHRQLPAGARAAAVLRRHEVLGPGGDPLHGPAQEDGEPGHEDLVAVRRALGPETPADVGSDDADLVLAEADDRRDLPTRPERRLGPQPHGQLVGGRVVAGHGGDARLIHADGDHARSGGEGRGGVAGPPRPGDRAVGAEALVDDGRGRGLRALGVQDRSERLVLDVDEVGRIARSREALGHDGDDRLTDEAHGAVGQEWKRRDLHVGEERIRRGLAEMLDVACRHDGHDPGGAPGRARIEPHDPRVAVRAAHEVHVQHAGHGDVVDVAATAGHERAVFHALARGADVAAAGRCHVSEGVERDAANAAAAPTNATTSG